MRGIILAGGSGTRLWPITKGISKQLMPIYDKPMVYYPLSTLMMAGIREVLVITTPEYNEQFKALLGDGSSLGMEIQYAVQPSPDGLAQAFMIGEEFLDGDSAALVLGDNIFHGTGLGSSLRAHTEVDGGVVFAYQVAEPSINEHYLDAGRLQVQVLDRGVAWLDTGTFESMMQASEYVKVIEDRQGFKIGCIEEIAWRAGWIDDAQLAELAKPLVKSGYGEYLERLLRHAKR